MTDIDIHSTKSGTVEIKDKIEHLLYNSIEPTLILVAIGALSGFFISIMAALGYLSLPGLGPVIASGISLTTSLGIIAGALCGGFLGFLFTCLGAIFQIMK